MSATDIFTVFCWISAFAMIATFTVISVRSGRAHPALWLTISAASIFWMESPYDWSMYAQFNPELAKLPAWGPFSFTWGGLPVMAAPGYVMYFGFPTLIAIAIAKRSSVFSYPVRLLFFGLLVGTLWDAAWEILGTQVGLWRFGRAAPGLVLWPETKYQVGIYCFLAMGTLVMSAAYLTGRVNSKGENIFEAWSRRKGHTGWKPNLIAAAGFILATHLSYALSMAPHVYTKVNGMQTVTSKEQLFEGIENQPL